MRAPFWLLVPLTAVAYFAAAKLGLGLAFVAEQVTIVWPPTGIALAALLLFGSEAWPGIFVGAFVANATTQTPLGTAAGIAAGNTLEALAGAWMLRSLDFGPALDRLRDVLALVVCGALLSTMLSASIGVTSLTLTGSAPWASFGTLWWVWWLGDALGDLVVAPLLLVWGDALARGVDRRRMPAIAALAAVTIVASMVAFAARSEAGFAGYPIHYLIFPLVIWGALRGGQLATTLLTFVAAAAAIWTTTQSAGPLAMSTVHESLLMVQLYMAVIGCTGLLLGAAIAERDGAEQRRARDFAALQASEERLRLALDAGRLGVWDWNVETGAVRWTENMEGLFGIPPGSFGGTFESFRTLLAPEQHERIDREIGRALGGGDDYEVELPHVWADGTAHWLFAKGRTKRDASGRVVRMLGTAVDVTERKQLEDELRARARALADADHRKDEFLAMLAHELRNPLAPLNTSLQLLRREDVERDRFLDTAERQVKHLIRLVDDLLDVSRISRGKITLRREAVLLADAVNRAIELTRADIEGRGQELTVSLPITAVRLHADAVRLVQVIANLLSNAAKYTPAGGSIWLTAERVEDEVVVRVRDDGVGIPAELLPKVFDLFVQGDASLDRTRGGLGIGLTIVRALVELHGGRVEARSPGVGLGSEMIVTLPVLPPTLDDRPGEAPEVIGRSSEHRLPILVVEDNQDAAETLAVLLEQWGHEVQIAFDGLAALRLAETFEPRVIISDLGLPGMNGFDLARRLREQPRFGRVLLIALSGYGRDEDRMRALDAGFDHHLVKPPDLDALLRLLGSVPQVGREAVTRTLQ